MVWWLRGYPARSRDRQSSSQRRMARASMTRRNATPNPVGLPLRFQSMLSLNTLLGGLSPNRLSCLLEHSLPVSDRSPEPPHPFLGLSLGSPPSLPELLFGSLFGPPQRPALRPRHSAPNQTVEAGGPEGARCSDRAAG